MPKVSITSETIANGALRSLVPELYALQDLVERNAWHRGETSFEHTVEVVRNVEELLLLPFIEDPDVRRQLLNHLASRLTTKKGARTRGELVLIGTALHDIGKLATYAKHPDGTTAFPGHEEAGVLLAIQIGARLELRPEESTLIGDLVRDHAKPNYLSTSVRGESASVQTRRMNELLEALGPNRFEIALLTLADCRSSNTRVTDHSLFVYQDDFLTRFLIIAATTIASSQAADLE